MCVCLVKVCVCVPGEGVVCVCVPGEGVVCVCAW